MIITINVLAIPLVILFVRPSVKVQYCVQTAKHVVNVFSPPDSPIILFFRSDRYYESRTENQHLKHNY